MTVRKVTTISIIISAITIVLMIIFRYTKSELFTLLSVVLGATIFFTLLFYLYHSESNIQKKKTTKNKYIFFAIVIPFLVFAVDVTEESQGIIKEIVRVLLAALVFYLIFSWVFNEWKSIQKLKNEKSKAELSLLKEQINPHFFFNTLNNLYSLIKKDSDAAQAYVLKLSDLMRFTIYDSGKEQVLLSEEVAYLNNFIELQTSRYHREIDVNFTKKIESPSAKIPPLLFINLVENAFKHGVEKTTNNAFIDIDLEEKAGRINFIIKNNCETEVATEHKGIGLRNLKDRLNLLYPNRHVLSYEINDEVYKAHLEILNQ